MRSGRLSDWENGTTGHSIRALVSGLQATQLVAIDVIAVGVLCSRVQHASLGCDAEVMR